MLCIEVSSGNAAGGVDVGCVVMKIMVVVGCAHSDGLWLKLLVIRALLTMVMFIAIFIVCVTMYKQQMLLFSFVFFKYLANTTLYPAVGNANFQWAAMFEFHLRCDFSGNLHLRNAFGIIA